MSLLSREHRDFGRDPLGTSTPKNKEIALGKRDKRRARRQTTQQNEVRDARRRARFIKLVTADLRAYQVLSQDIIEGIWLKHQNHPGANRAVFDDIASKIVVKQRAAVKPPSGSRPRSPWAHDSAGITAK